ncbi:MAG: hypothetical protein ABID61_06435 [Candidatus Micrarchaeota archaeon]
MALNGFSIIKNKEVFMAYQPSIPDPNTLDLSIVTDNLIMILSILAVIFLVALIVYFLFRGKGEYWR